jgi:hypothetical protein
MDSTQPKSIGLLAGSMIWLALLYGALLYVAVGALGVSEMMRRLGTDASNIVHMVEVVNDIREGEMTRVRQEEKSRREKEAQLDKAIRAFRTFGSAQGLALQDLQPIIDDYDLAPRLSQVLKRDVDPATEAQWAEVMGDIMQAQFDIRDLKKSIESRYAILRLGWTAHPQVLAEVKRIGMDSGLVDRSAGMADTLQRLGYASLFSLPPEILTLLLALSMGALGSTLHITKTLLNPTEVQPPSYYLIRPFQGMVTSLVVFVLLKAGQLTISVGDSDNLNIFFVSFAGIASGLLAEEAYRMIRKAGAGIIKTDADDSRWAFKLKSAMEAMPATAEALAAGIGSSPDEVNSWMNESQPVPALQQRLIAAWLRMPERELFTSQPPTEEKAMASPPQLSAAE